MIPNSGFCVAADQRSELGRGGRGVGVRVVGVWSQQRVPLVEAQVAVCELFQQRPLDDAFRGSVLKEIDKSVLQAGVLLWRGLLLGELIQAGVLLVESLPEGDGVYVHMQFLW